MIENLSKREKTLASVTVGSLVVALLFGGFLWFLNSYNDNAAVLQSIDSRISDQENLTLQGMQAATRKRYYHETSPTSNIANAKNQYIAWLKKTFKRTTDRTLDVDPGKNLTLKLDSKVVAEQMSFTIRPSVTLKELVGFLDAFYCVDTLHRIKLLKMTPRTEIAGKKRVRTGQLSLQMQIEVLVLKDGIKRSQLPTVSRDTGIPIEKAMETIVRRDVFGPANNAPTVKISKSSSYTYTPGKTVSINVTASDADEEDTLSMKLIESDVLEAELKPDAKGSRGKLTLPSLPAGKYEFMIRVSDNGLPAKSTDEKLQITFKDPRPKPKPKPKPEPKLVKKAVETFITGNLKNADGNWCVLIKSRMDGKSYRLTKGESFKLDKRDWEVTDITPDSATFNVDGQEVKLDRGVAFSEADLEDIE